MPITETTSHLGLQLPHPSNSLEDDVLRVRSAITAVDAQFLALDTLLASDDPALDTLQEVVDVLKDNVAVVFDHVGAGGAAHADATGSVDGFMSASDKTKLNGVTLGPVFDAVQITPATEGQTAFTVSGGYTPGAIMVFLNGIKLLPADFTAATSPNLVLTEGAATVDTLEVIRFKSAHVAV